MKRLLLSMLMLALVAGLACTRTENPDKGGDTTTAADAGEKVDRPDPPPDTPDPHPSEGKAPAPKGDTQDGKKTGTWTYFHADGSKAAEGPYENDLKHGKWTYWYAKGKKAAEGMYSKGEKTGHWRSWEESGAEITKQVFVEGLRPTK